MSGEDSFFLQSVTAHGIEWVAMFAYFDETTGGDKNDQLDAVAGYLFDLQGLAHFLKRYREYVEPLIPVDDAGRKIFHASPCLDGGHQYFGTERPIREAILGRMATVIAESVTLGVVVGVEHAEYERGTQGNYMKVDISPGQAADDLRPWLTSRYSTCLARCIDAMNQWLDKQHPFVTDIEYVMESGSPYQVEATDVLSRMAAHKELRRRYRLRKYSFIPKGPEDPWLFAADYYAWEWQRYDRFVSNPDKYPNERAYLQDALDAKPHLALYLSEASVNVQALINTFYRLVPLKDGSSS